MTTLLFAAILAATTPQPTPPPDLNTPPADAMNIGNGLITKTITAGKSTEMPSDDDFVKIRYTLWSSPDGKLLDFIAPPQFVAPPVNMLMPGLKQTVTLMHPGETRRSWIQERLGARGRVPAGGMLVADVELLEIIHPPAPPPDVAAPPKEAIVTKSGLAYKVLRKGTGTRHPKIGDTVVVHYTGWQTTGHRFDSSVLRGEPAEFPLRDVIAGWREGLQLLTEGERARLWIPQELAYKGQQGKPMGMLVFDVELVKIK
ncbi:MAG TPA: FKBP-type peptidyl-prolyl cis-trans isomerase [Thermoanaerobaculia bacterium]|nr:FKBP-type peptidyl-prolyl cis-trans isomerase [Thermoanaerobaculia bacterium]